MYVTVHFICIDIVDMNGMQNKRELQNQKFVPTVVFDPGTFRLPDRRVIHCVIKPFYWLSFICILYENTLHCIKTNQSNRGNIISFNFHLIEKFFEGISILLTFLKCIDK